MHRWPVAHRVALLSLLTAATLGAAQSPTPPPKRHPGRLVDADGGAGLNGTAYAYKGDRRDGGRLACPSFSDLLDTKPTTRPNGNFEFVITDNMVASYYAVYCADGYAWRGVNGNPNLADGEPVLNSPVALESR